MNSEFPVETLSRKYLLYFRTKRTNRVHIVRCLYIPIVCIAFNKDYGGMRVTKYVLFKNEQNRFESFYRYNSIFYINN